MFQVGDRVEVIAEGDSLYGCFGEIIEICDYRYRIGVVLDEEATWQVVLWFGEDEIRKVGA